MIGVTDVSVLCCSEDLLGVVIGCADSEQAFPRVTNTDKKTHVATTDDNVCMCCPNNSDHAISAAASPTKIQVHMVGSCKAKPLA